MAIYTTYFFSMFFPCFRVRTKKMIRKKNKEKVKFGFEMYFFVSKKLNFNREEKCPCFLHLIKDLWLRPSKKALDCGRRLLSDLQRSWNRDLVNPFEKPWSNKNFLRKVSEIKNFLQGGLSIYSWRARSSRAQGLNKEPPHIWTKYVVVSRVIKSY